MSVNYITDKMVNKLTIMESK